MTSEAPKPKEIKPRPPYSIHPWEARHKPTYSKIVAYVEASGNWEPVLTIHPTSGVGHESMAVYILNLINDNLQNRPILAAAMEALEICRDRSELSLSSEKTADAVLLRLKRRVG